MKTGIRGWKDGSMNSDLYIYVPWYLDTDCNRVTIKKELDYDLSAPMNSVPQQEIPGSSPSHLNDGLSQFMDRYPEKGTIRSGSFPSDTELMEE